MLYEVLLSLVGGFVAFVAGVVIYTVVTCQLARWRFIKATKGLPMPDESSWFCNGTLKWGVRKHLNAYLWAGYEEFKNSKTVGSLYGTIPTVMTIDFDLIKRILAEPEKHRDRIERLNMPFGEMERSVFLARGEHWRRPRRSFATALKPNKFKTPNVMSEIDLSIQKLVGLIDFKLADKSKLAPDGGRLVDVDDLANRYSLDIHFSCFYKQPDVINFDERPCDWAELTVEGLRAIQENTVFRTCLVFPILVPLVEWLLLNFHPQGQWRHGINQFIRRQTLLGVQARKEARELRESGQKFDPDNFTLKDGTKFRRNMFDHVVDDFLDGKLTNREFFDNSFFMLNAANKTSADPIVQLIYRLAIHPEYQEKARKSVQLDGAQSEYLSWMIDECLRLMPPVSSGAARSLGEDMEIDGGKYVLPKDTFVVMPTYVIHRLPEFWGEDSEEFKPERWQDTSKHHPLQYMPFGAGHRACPGRDFALFQIKQLFAVLLTKYKFEAKIKDDLHLFDSPFFFVQLPNSPTYVTIKKLDHDQQANASTIEV